MQLLFTPGPLTTSAAVKEAMLVDKGSRDAEFIAVVAAIRQSLLAIGGVSPEQGYEAVLIPGSGTFGLEAVVSSITAPHGKWLVVVNGAYGERIARIAKRHGIPVTILRYAENESPNASDVDRELAADPAVTHVAVVHCETTSGILNRVDEIGTVVRKHKSIYVLDSMSAFGGIPFDVGTAEVDFLISSANKCIEGVPGFSFVIARRDHLLATEGWARTVSLDLLAQWRGLEQNGQFLFTPPTHVLLAFSHALAELEREGGVAARAQRYQANHDVLVQGMRQLGFKTFVPDELQSAIITTFQYPVHERFEFDEFYTGLSRRGFLIYPGKITATDCFRIGTIGQIFPRDVDALLDAIRETMVDLEVPVPLTADRDSVPHLHPDVSN
jgi:2-aminoethylphosphonate-pyruvate transaminase